jgi:hypothetical protein
MDIVCCGEKRATERNMLLGAPRMYCLMLFNLNYNEMRCL